MGPHRWTATFPPPVQFYVLYNTIQFKASRPGKHALYLLRILDWWPAYDVILLRSWESYLKGHNTMLDSLFLCSVIQVQVRYPNKSIFDKVKLATYNKNAVFLFLLVISKLHINVSLLISMCCNSFKMPIKASSVVKVPFFFSLLSWSKTVGSFVTLHLVSQVHVHWKQRRWFKRLSF